MQVCLPSKQPGLRVPQTARPASLCDTGTAAPGSVSSTQVTCFRCFHRYITVPVFKHCKFFCLINTGRQLDYLNLGACSQRAHRVLPGCGGTLSCPVPRVSPRLGWAAAQCVTKALRGSSQTTSGHSCLPQCSGASPGAGPN